MSVYIIRRIIQMVPVFIGVTLVVFIIFTIGAGDPVLMILGDDASVERIHEMRAQLGLDRPFHIQYLSFVANILQGDLGTSISTRQPVTMNLIPAIKHTLRLTIVSLIFVIVLSLPIGIIAATRPNTILDYFLSTGLSVGISAPSFWTGILLMYIFAYLLRIFPTGGSAHWSSVILPAITIALHHGAIMGRMTRSCMLEVLGHDYIRTARSKGIKESVVTMHHAFRNASLPLVTTFGLLLGRMLAGAVLVESVFAWPGIGRLMVVSINARDIPTVQSTILLIAMAYAFVNLFVDLFYVLLDPRIRLT